MGFTFLIIGYYIVWIGSLILAAHNFAYYPLTLSITVSLCQLFYIKKHYKPMTTLLFMFIFSLSGFIVDSLFNYFMIIHFETNPWLSIVAPPWILGLWINFSVLCVALTDILRRYFRLLWCIAFVGFPLAYNAGVQFGAATFSKGYYSMCLQGATWMVLFPLLCCLLPSKFNQEQEI